MASGNNAAKHRELRRAMPVVHGARSACRRETRTLWNVAEPLVPTFEPGCRGFDSLQVRHFWLVQARSQGPHARRWPSSASLTTI